MAAILVYSLQNNFNYFFFLKYKHGRRYVYGLLCLLGLCENQEYKVETYRIFSAILLQEYSNGYLQFNSQIRLLCISIYCYLGELICIFSLGNNYQLFGENVET